MSMATPRTRGTLAEQLAALLPRCPGCGARFTPVRPGQKFCRPSCRAAEARGGPVRPGGGDDMTPCRQAKRARASAKTAPARHARSVCLESNPAVL